MINNRHWVEIVEYISVAASVVGTAVAAVSQQAIYAAAPVSLSLVLNLINRSRLSEVNHQNPPAAIARVDELQSDLAQMQQSAQGLLTAVEALHQQQNTLKQSVAPIQAQVDVLSEQFKKRPELQQIESLAAVLAALQQYIDRLPQQDRGNGH